MESVILKLGEPDVVSADKRTIVYGSRKIVGELFAPVLERTGNEPNISRFLFLTIFFDDHGIVTNVRFTTQLDS